MLSDREKELMFKAFSYGFSIMDEDLITEEEEFDLWLDSPVDSQGGTVEALLDFDSKDT